MSPASLYTRSVGLNQRTISIVVLAILTALPVSGTLCAMLCESAASSPTSVSGHHHGSTTDVDEPAPFSTSAQVRSVSDHDCNSHDGALRQASTTATERANWDITSIPSATTIALATFKAPADSGPHFEYSTPPGSAPPTTTPLVLRV